jgi:hypothetical protein
MWRLFNSPLGFRQRPTADASIIPSGRLSARSPAHRLQSTNLGVGCRWRARHFSPDGAVVCSCPAGLAVRARPGQRGGDSASAWRQGLWRQGQQGQFNGRGRQAPGVAGAGLPAATPASSARCNERLAAGPLALPLPLAGPVAGPMEWVEPVLVG